MTWVSNLLIPDELMFELRNRCVKGVDDEKAIIFIIKTFLNDNPDIIITQEMVVDKEVK